MILSDPSNKDITNYLLTVPSDIKNIVFRYKTTSGIEEDVVPINKLVLRGTYCYEEGTNRVIPYNLIVSINKR